MTAPALNDAKTKKFMEHLMSLTPNRKCADCGKNNPAWCAWTFGFFVCYECSGQHRRLGPNVSRVKSTTMDAWTAEELRRMYVGGNKFAYKVPASPDVTVKYHDTKDFVAELDALCEASRAKEPGTAFMELDKRPKSAGFGSAVIRKKSVPRLRDCVVEDTTETPVPSDVGSAEHSAPRDAPRMEQPTKPAKAASPSEVVLSRSNKSYINASNSVNSMRSPFSFKPQERTDSDSE
ncbi:hypothetical protein PAPHI01_0308 [Pancytospora philotis]|nr:hypothetical protein PAPHI01_0308 [Pancytospora philotis]